jgi:hypothetical protein
MFAEREQDGTMCEVRCAKQTNGFWKQVCTHAPPPEKKEYAETSAEEEAKERMKLEGEKAEERTGKK